MDRRDSLPMMLRILLCSLLLAVAARAAGKPAVILITVDGLGWGDLSASGNAQVPTPRLDKLLAECAVFRDFHVTPLDAPSRAALLTGQYPYRVGVWGNHSGRNRLRFGVTTLSSHLKSAGYLPAIFGTWALGDNHPGRPQDQGYGEVLIHPGDRPGGVADFYSNDGTDDLWLLRGEPVSRKGSPLEVCFDAALTFISKNTAVPFFCHLSPSLPARMPETAIESFRNRPGIHDPLRAAWISELDAAVGNLLDRLETMNLGKSTIIVITSTSGPPAPGKGKQAFNAGRRGYRGSPYEGGHCVPFLIRWPEGGVVAGNVNTPAAHVDLLPTVAELTGVPLSPEFKPDGISLVPLLHGPPATQPEDRVLFTDAQEIPVPVLWRQSCVISGPWRLVNGRELYDLRTDPGQRKDVAGSNAETVQRLTGGGRTWWESLPLKDLEPTRITIGGPQDPVLLTPLDWLSRSAGPVTREDVIRGTPANGPWLLNVVTEGSYDILLRRWPLTVNRSLHDSFFTPDKARLRVGTMDETRPVTPEAIGVNFRVTLKPGPAALQTWLTGEGKTCGAYFVEVRRAVEVRSAKPVKQPIDPVKPAAERFLREP
ncbi:MAG TPA: sulfatase-like hydrolase/transferase [Verrucomicrobiales bacterium]|nr:sulfatase-like hydrolase/transferase [Verrucomicrobiales bacterium]